MSGMGEVLVIGSMWSSLFSVGLLRLWRATLRSRRGRWTWCLGFSQVNTSEWFQQTRSPTTELWDAIAELEQRQQRLAGEWQQFTDLRATAAGLQTRLRESQDTQSLLSSSSLAAQQRRGVSQLSDDPGHQIYNKSNRHQHLAREINAMRESIAEFQQQADAAWEAIQQHQEEIAQLQSRIEELQAVSADDEHGPRWGEGAGYRDDDDGDEDNPEGGYNSGYATTGYGYHVGTA
ncbi:hypothetical protein CEP54_001531 [Fusarium duplospermum]|uniref:Uncharacterized protein n=1 Tax=Fusarium duplospermum TaxID=1325734 RepID=A0A428R068_9HYPO|nr:hypothetical protein CEP54_001531 [Fusarium duplospermum]